MRRLIAHSLLVTQLTGCFSHVVNVGQVLASNNAVLNGKTFSMPKPGCYIDSGHGRFCTGSEYVLDSSQQWTFDKDIAGVVRQVYYKVPESKIDWHDVGQTIGAVAMLGLVGAAIYRGGFGGRYVPPYPENDPPALVNAPNSPRVGVIPSSTKIEPSTRRSVYDDSITPSKHSSFDQEITIKDRSDPLHRYNGSIDKFGHVTAKDFNGNTLRGDLDQDGYGALHDQNGNITRVKP